MGLKSVSTHPYRLTAYSKEKTLFDGSKATIRPIVEESEAKILECFLQVPQEARHYLKEGVASPVVMRQLSEVLDYDRVRSPPPSSLSTAE
ncbi:MAG: N-acetyltransferase protein [Dehalococcoidia bacterium]|nr:N-acetyltransferase protein [Dehalococcoidia bacterium]